MPRKKWPTLPVQDLAAGRIEDREEPEPIFERMRILPAALHSAAGRRGQVYPSLTQNLSALAGLYRAVLWMFWQRIRYGRGWQYHLASGAPRHQSGRRHQGAAS